MSHTQELPTWTLPELHKLLGLKPRLLRYCLDHNLVPDVTLSQAVGRPRRLSWMQCLGLLCAVELLQYGITYAVVAQFIGEICQRADLEQLLKTQCLVYAELGDAANVRIYRVKPFENCSWYIPGNPATIDVSYHPQSVLRLNLTTLAQPLAALSDPTFATT